MTNGDAPDTTDGNPFSLLAYIVFKVRQALEGQVTPNRPPRWVRISRGAKFKDEPIGAGVGFAVQGLADSVTFLAELTLDLEELLFQTDAAKAMAEVVLKMVSAVGDDQFKAGIAALFDDSGNNPTLQEVNSVLDGIQNAVEDIETVLEYIPEPEDVESLGHEFYRLMCLVQQEFPRDSNDNSIDTGNADLVNPELQIDIAQTGKVWPCIWAYNDGAAADQRKHVTARGLGDDEAGSVDLEFFGLRRLWTHDTNALPQRAKLVWSGDAGEIEIYDHNFDPALDPTDNIAETDLSSLIELLNTHGYNDPDIGAAVANEKWAAIRVNLMKFQFLNDLAVTGELDNSTVNRLLNLDFERKNLRRAVPYESATWPWDTPNQPPVTGIDGYLRLINPGAENFDEENVAAQSQAGSPYRYYVLPTSPGGILPKSVDNWPEKQGWLSEANNARGFVGMRSRAANPAAGDTPPSGDTSGRFVGGLYSEGEAAFGDFFWAARHTEPWIPGRKGTPGSNALFGGQQPQPESPDGPVISRMFQWVALPDWLDPNAPPEVGLTLYMQASALQRSLFSDRNGGGYPDQGRIRLELHPTFDAATTPLNLPAVGVASASSTTEWFPSHGLNAAILDIAIADRKRLWTVRRSQRLEIPVGTAAVCLIAEGRHQSAFDIDAYFEDFKIQWMWRDTP